MSAATSKPGTKAVLRRIGAVLLAAAMAAAATPALADGKHKHWKHNHGNHYGHYKHPQVVYYDDGPDVIYVEPRPVYVRERVYVQPRPVYVEPRPSINIVVPLFD
jgi:hypothetical protein